MRRFKCLVFEPGSSAPDSCCLSAADEGRALDQVLRDFIGARKAEKVEVYEHDALLFVVDPAPEGAAPARDDARASAALDAEVSREIAKSISGWKILGYGLELAEGQDPQLNALLQSLLVREEDRFAACAEQLDCARTVLMTAHERVAAQLLRVADLRSRKEDTALAVAVLDQLQRTQAHFQAYAAGLEARLAAASPSNLMPPPVEA
jgi:hypothetical protein